MITRIVGAALVVAVLAILYTATYETTPKQTSPDAMQNADDGALRGLKIN